MISAEAPGSVLVVEDDEATAELERRVLSRVGRPVLVANRSADAIRILSDRGARAVVLDYRLAEGASWEVLDAAAAAAPRVPVIFVTAMGDERVAAEAIHRGAFDYLIKTGDFAERLPALVERAVRSLEAEEATARLASIVESSSDAIVGQTLDGTIVSWNQAAEKLFGRSATEVLRRPFVSLLPPDRAGEFVAMLRAVASGSGARRLETTGVAPDGRRMDLAFTVSPVRDRSGRTTGASVIARDVTERRRMAAELEEKARLAMMTAEVGIALSQGDGLPGVLERAAQSVVASLQATLAAVWTADADGFSLAAAAGPAAGRALLPKTVRMGEGALGGIAEGRKPLHSANPAAEPMLAGLDWVRRPDVAAFAALPLLAAGAAHGLVVILAPAPLSKFAMLSLATIADTLAIGLQRHRSEQEQERLREQFLQSQKMEAVGRLAGGIAHDFNNILTVINGYSHIGLSRIAPSAPGWRELNEIRASGERAAALTGQLLAFSRKQVLEPRRVTLNEVVADMERMLRRTLGEDVRLETVLAPDPCVVWADRSQLEQIVLNLAVNARDAMPGGGALILETSVIEFETDTVGSSPPIPPGRYVVLTVTDTGTGMTPEIQSRIFEPFFTTKEIGRGTGLGLSTVYGIVVQSRGHIRVYSEPGEGTTFRVYLPRVDGAPEEGAGEPPRVEDLKGTETILVVEDEKVLNEMIRSILAEAGYTALGVPDGQAAVEFSRGHSEPIHLVLTDLVLPRLGGADAYLQIAMSRPGVRVLFMSGYSGAAMAGERAPLLTKAPFLAKPFSPDALLRAIRAALAAPT